MSEYPNLDLFHARINEIPEWGRKMLGDMLINLSEERREKADIRAKLEATEKAAREFQAQVAMMCGALGSIVAIIGALEENVDDAESEIMCIAIDALQSTPEAERVQGLVDALKPFAEYPLIQKSCDDYTVLVNPWGKEQKEIWRSDFDRAKEALAKYRGESEAPK